MDPITLIVTALGAGAASVTSDVASSAVQDAYATLKALLRQRFAGRSEAELVLSKHESAPATWQALLAAELGQVGADRDADLVTAAQALMSLVDKAGTSAGRYTVEVRDASGVQVGDGNQQDNVFNPPSGDQTFGAEHWDG
jgi:hypothetical protein